MQVITVLFGLLVFVVLLFVFLRVTRPTAASARLHEVARQTRPGADKEAPATGYWESSMDRLTEQASRFRSRLGGEANPADVRRLMRAGFHKPSQVDMFLMARLVLPACGALAVTLLVRENVIFYFVVALVVGYFLPDFWLGYMIHRRRERIRLSLPDALDLMSICMEAGLAMDQALVRVGQELRVSHPELSEEFLQINMEQRAGARRIDAWKAFSDRTEAESVRSFVAMLVQADRFGTPVARALGTFSDSLRTQRRQRAEEAAAKTTIKLVFPLALFIFPNIFIVTLAPAVLGIMRNIGHIVE
jgi:tight adherence protein C